MTRKEWVATAAYMSAAVGKDFTEQQAEVYFDLLGDLPAKAVLAAAKQCLVESSYPVIPPAGALRKVATAIVGGAHRQPLPMEAWEMARLAVGRYGLSREREALASMPEAVAKTVRAVGWRSMCDTRLDDLDTLRAHFLKAYESAALREQREALLPASLKQMIAAIGNDAALPREDNRTSQQVIEDLLNDKRNESIRRQRVAASLPRLPEKRQAD